MSRRLTQVEAAVYAVLSQTEWMTAYEVYLQRPKVLLRGRLRDGNDGDHLADSTVETNLRCLVALGYARADWVRKNDGHGTMRRRRVYRATRFCEVAP